MDHYITAVSMSGEWTAIACRCGWFAVTSGNPTRVWNGHYDEELR